MRNTSRTTTSTMTHDSMYFSRMTAKGKRAQRVQRKNSTIRFKQSKINWR